MSEHRNPRAVVYIAGPYTHPDPVANTNDAIRYGMWLYERQWAFPLIPHLSLLAHLVSPRPVEFWYEWDFNLLALADVLWRMPGESVGAEAEEIWAKAHGVPVFVAGQELELIKWLRFRAGAEL